MNTEFNSNGVIADYISCNNDFVVRVPKTVARVKLCGGALTFNFNDTMQFEMPTEDQCENLRKIFGIEVELVNED
jgi:hypothetical protein